ncbi:MAG: DUF3592 domain-containing protein [candidate division Zixibacteria bacterium]|nr:DUF3592 domain-containing protein [candidate division Zixibacteria bacterium]NIW41911.1 DUF3592 domain-containing protein [candidate division Zixibacteria bacterium]NIX01377.1 DUF3592 domain-containing protein [Phycisphaerae bacterium]
MKGTVVLVVICGLFLLFGILTTVTTVDEVHTGLASRDWPTVDGEILLAQRHRGRRARHIKRFEYRYAVDGIEHTSTRAAFVRVPYIDPLYRKYRSGQAIKVYYDPSDPTRSVIEPGAPVLGVLAKTLVPLVMTGLGVAGLFFGLKQRKQRS